MSPDERLRAAAARLREVAGAATPGPWERQEKWALIYSGSDAVVHAFYAGVCECCGEGIEDNAQALASVEDTTYIAMMGPPVALALADWLDAEAQDRSHDPGKHDGSPSGYALAVADAVLGGGE